MSTESEEEVGRIITCLEEGECLHVFAENEGTALCELSVGNGSIRVTNVLPRDEDDLSVWCSERSGSSRIPRWSLCRIDTSVDVPSLRTRLTHSKLDQVCGFTRPYGNRDLLLTASSESGAILVWDERSSDVVLVQSARARRHLRKHGLETIICTSIHPSLCFARTQDTELFSWDLNTDKIVATSSGQEGQGGFWRAELGFMPRFDCLASGAGHSMCVWDIKSSELVVRHLTKSTQIQSLAVLSDVLVVTAGLPSANVYDVRNLISPVHKFHVPGCNYWGLVGIDDQHFVAATQGSGSDSGIAKYQADGKQVYRVETEYSMIGCCYVPPEDERVALVDELERVFGAFPSIHEFDFRVELSSGGFVFAFRSFCCLS